MPSFTGDLHIKGTLKADKLTAPAKCIDNEHIADDADIEATKVVQQVYMEYRQPHGSAVVDARETIHIANAPGDLVVLRASLVVKSVTGATVEVMIKKNGVDVLNNPLVIDDADANFAVIESTDFTALPYVNGDTFEAVVDAEAGGGTVGQGLFVQLIGREAAE
jgi:hypothetical protein